MPADCKENLLNVDLAEKYDETVIHLLARCTSLKQKECPKRHNAVLMTLAVDWAKMEKILKQEDNEYFCFLEIKLDEEN